jgi:hypothetical protein
MNITQLMADQGIDFVYESTSKKCFITVCFNGTRYRSTNEEIGFYEELKNQVRDGLREEGVLHDSSQSN